MMKKIKLKQPYIAVEKIDKETTDSGLVLSTSKDTDLIYGKVIGCDESLSISDGDVVLFIKDKAYTFIDEGKEYFIISEDEDLIGVIKEE